MTRDELADLTLMIGILVIVYVALFLGLSAWIGAA